MPGDIISTIIPLAGVGLALCFGIYVLKKIGEFIDDLVKKLMAGITAIFWLLLIAGVVYALVH